MELIGSRSFGDVVFLLLSGDLPKGDEGRMMEALLVSCAEHSVLAPSVDAARKFTASDDMARVPTTSAHSSTKNRGLWFGAALAGSWSNWDS